LGKTLLRIICIDITNHTYTYICTVTEKMTQEKCGLVADLYQFNMICFQYNAQVCVWDNGSNVLCKVLQYHRTVFMKLTGSLSP
jgi:hypothetical protein